MRKARGDILTPTRCERLSSTLTQRPRDGCASASKSTATSKTDPRVQRRRSLVSLVVVDKLRDVVGLYVDPPAHAIVLSLDEKSQIQALDRTQPGLPLKKGRLGTMTHDYKRHGTTTLFAALNVLDGTVIGRNMQRHRHQEFMRFLNAIEAEVPAGKMVHVILDNYAAHKHPKVRAWLDRHERFVFHFTPTSCSWLNAVEGFFARLSRRRLKRGVFRSVVDLQAAINRFLAETNAEPKPFTWTADPDKIIAAVRRGHQVLDPHPLVSAYLIGATGGARVWGGSESPDRVIMTTAAARPKQRLVSRVRTGVAGRDEPPRQSGYCCDRAQRERPRMFRKSRHADRRRRRMGHAALAQSPLPPLPFLHCRCSRARRRSGQPAAPMCANSAVPTCRIRCAYWHACRPIARRAIRN